MGMWTVTVEPLRCSEIIDIKVFSTALHKCKTFLFPENCGAKYRPNNVPNILRNWIGNKAGKAPTKPRRTQLSHRSANWLHHSLPAGISHQDADLGFTDCLHSRLPPTRNESHKVQIWLRASNANGEVSSFRLSVFYFCWHCHNGSPHLSLQHGPGSPT